MAGLDPATQGHRANFATTQSKPCSGCSRSLALGGRVKPGHDELGMV